MWSFDCLLDSATLRCEWLHEQAAELGELRALLLSVDRATTREDHLMAIEHAMDVATWMKSSFLQALESHESSIVRSFQRYLNQKVASYCSELLISDQGAKGVRELIAHCVQVIDVLLNEVDADCVDGQLLLCMCRFCTLAVRDVDARAIFATVLSRTVHRLMDILLNGDMSIYHASTKHRVRDGVRQFLLAMNEQYGREIHFLWKENLSSSVLNAVNFFLSFPPYDVHTAVIAQLEKRIVPSRI